MKVLSSEFKSYNINGFAIVALSMKEALQYVWAINNPLDVIVRFNEEQSMKMRIQVGYQSEFLEDSIAIALEDRIEAIGISHEGYEVLDLQGNWLSSSEL